MKSYTHFTHVVLPHDAPTRVGTAARVLVEEIALRTQHTLSIVDTPVAGAPCFVLGTTTCPGTLADLWPDADLTLASTSPDAYRVRGTVTGDADCIGILGNSPRGLLFGVGRILRQMHMTTTAWQGPVTLQLDAAPVYPLIGHQLGYRDKTNSYCGWDEVQFDRYIRELALFGTNTIEVLPPRTDDRDTSIHFPLPHLDMMAQQAQICDTYGLDVWIWLPVMLADYTEPDQVAEERDFWTQVLSRLPRLDNIFVPGGDPGHTSVPVLLDLLANLSTVVTTYHPGVKIWISPQGFTASDLDYFLAYLRNQRPDWVGGVVHGPWVNIPMSQFRTMVPAAYPIRNYPDITHTLSSQFPVPDWDVAFAMTVGREPVNPRPVDAEHCFRFSQPGTIGMLSYSEGCNDDVNKIIWSGLSWHDQQDVFSLLVEYGRFFIDPELAHDFAHGLLALERNWRGPLALNTGVQATLRQFQALEKAASPFVRRNWRFQQPLYRAYYDAYIHQRLLYESGLQVQALDCLEQASSLGACSAIREALRLWDQAVSRPIATHLRTRIFQLAEALFQSIRMQLSVPLYQAQYETRGANLDAVDFPLNDRGWWHQELSRVLTLETEELRLARIRELLTLRDPTPGGFHDDLVRSYDLSRVQDRVPYATDPGGLSAPSRRFLYRKAGQQLPLTWRGALVTLGQTPLRMQYVNLEEGADYELRIAYAGQSRNAIRLETAEGVLIHDYRTTRQTPDWEHFDIPAHAICNGVLNLIWRPSPHVASSGVVCNISEIVLCKKRWLS